MKIAILGVGVSGLSLGRMLTDRGINVEIYEEENHIGGLGSTEIVDGYVFDCYRIPTLVVTSVQLWWLRINRHNFCRESGAL